ncbi:hypothetical protein [Succinivibrio dextrinosolvens]|uniref:hypothetical protein n=1 Tax=Succinivibrio dextrinosolvens TaxID=83771 RepID=UPI0004E21514|nr:hypothetical protein [Succinivibrio dextrinosolvens]
MIKGIRNHYATLIYICIAIAVFSELMSISALGVSYDSLAHLLNRIHKLSRWILILIVADQLILFGFNKLKASLLLLFIFFIAFSAKTWILFDLLFIPLLLAQNCNSKKMYSIIFWTLVSGTFFIITIDYFELFIQYDFSRNETIRHSFGFYHPNSLGLTLMLIGMLLALMKNKLKPYDFIFLIILCFSIKYFTDSRSAFYPLTILTISLFIINYYEKYISMLFGKTLTFFSIFFILFVISIMFYMIISGNGIEYVDRIINGRLNYGKQALDEYGITLLGQKITISIEWEAAKGAKYFVIDSLYYYFPIVVGIIPSLFLLGAYIYSVKQTIKEKNIKLYVILMLFVLYGIPESVAFTSGLCMFVFLSPFMNLYKKQIR